MLTYVRILNARTRNKKNDNNKIITKIDRVCIHNTLFYCMLSLPLSCSMFHSPLVDSEMILKRERPLNFLRNSRATALILYILLLLSFIAQSWDAVFGWRSSFFFRVCVYSLKLKKSCNIFDKWIKSTISYVSSKLY